MPVTKFVMSFDTLVKNKAWQFRFKRVVNGFISHYENWPWEPWRAGATRAQNLVKSRDPLADPIDTNKVTQICGQPPLLGIWWSKVGTQSPDLERELYDLGQDHGGTRRAPELLNIFDH